MKKKLFAAACLTLVLSLGITCAGADVRADYEENEKLIVSDCVEDSYYKANSYGILNWFARNGDFTVPITRAEFSDMVFHTILALKKGFTAEIDVCESEPFMDTGSFSAYCLAKLGIFNGVGNGAFYPDGAITREQAAAVLLRMGRLLSYEYAAETKRSYSDGADISLWALDAVGAVSDWGVLRGYGDGSFMPKAFLTREQAAAALVRFLEASGFGEDASSTAAGDDSTPGADGYYLGNEAYVRITDETLTLEIGGKKAAELPADGYSGLGYQKMNGKYVVYAARGGSTDFFTAPDSVDHFTVDGSVRMITNRYIITEDTRYAFPSVDAAYTVYSVYDLNGSLIESMGLTDIELHAKGYIGDL